MEKALHEVPPYWDFFGLQSWNNPITDESTILGFRRTFEEHKLADKILAMVNDMLRRKGLMMRSRPVVDSALIAAPSWTKNRNGEGDPEIHQTKKSNLW